MGEHRIRSQINHFSLVQCHISIPPENVREMWHWTKMKWVDFEFNNEKRKSSAKNVW